MKNVVVGSFILVFASLMIGCGGGGGGGSAVTPGANAAVAGSPYGVGQGYWSNQINVTNQSQYFLYLANAGICSMGCPGVSPYLMGLSIDTTNLPNGVLPGKVKFDISPVGGNTTASLYSTNYDNRGFSLQRPLTYRTGGCGNTSNNGFVLNYYSLGGNVNNFIPTVGLNYGGSNVNSLCQLFTNPGQAPTLQIIATWIDPNQRTTLHVSVNYNGQQIADGNIGGTDNNWNNINPAAFYESYGPGAFGGQQVIQGGAGTVWVVQQQGPSLR